MSLTKIGSIGINTGIQFAGVTTVSTLHVGSGVTLSSDGDIFATGVSTFSGNLKVGSGVTISPDGDGFYTGVVTATTFSGALAASNLTGALPAISGANLTNLDASDLASGTVPTARLGSGTASSSTFLRGDSTFQTVNTDLVSDTSPQLGGNLDAGSHDIIFDDNSKLKLGNDNDLQIYHSGSSSWVYDNGTGDLNIASNGSTINMAVGASANYIAAKFISEGAAELYHNNERKIFTHATGIQVEDATSTAASIVMSTSSGTSGSLYASGNNTLGLLDGQNHYMIKGVKDGAVELYYNNSLKLHTVNGGVEIEGNLQVDGSGTSVTIQPTDGLINFGMDGRSSFVTGTNSCYIYSGSGASGSMPAGDLIIQSRSDQNRTIRFVTGSSPAQRMSIDSGGLKFGTDTADANALDDYEEGSFTPEIRFGGNTNNQTYSYQMGRYTKIGNRVVFHLYVKFSNKGTASGAAHIYGLPFTSAGVSVGYAHCSAWMNQGNFGETVPTGYIPPSAAYYNIERQRCDNDTGVSACDNTNFNNNTDMMVGGSYITTA